MAYNYSVRSLFVKRKMQEWRGNANQGSVGRSPTYRFSSLVCAPAVVRVFVLSFSSYSPGLIPLGVGPFYLAKYQLESCGISMAGSADLRGIFMASSWHVFNNHLSFQLLTEGSFIRGNVSSVGYLPRKVPCYRASAHASGLCQPFDCPPAFVPQPLELGRYCLCWRAGSGFWLRLVAGYCIRQWPRFLLRSQLD